MVVPRVRVSARVRVRVSPNPNPNALDRVEAALEGRRVERLELGPRERHLEVD